MNKNNNTHFNKDEVLQQYLKSYGYLKQSEGEPLIIKDLDHDTKTAITRNP